MARPHRGLEQMWQALMPVTDKIERVLTLGFVRMMFDPDTPEVAGFDPRNLKRALFPLAPPYAVMAQDGNARGWLEAITGQLAKLTDEPELFVTDWSDVNVGEAMKGLGKYPIEDYCGGDLLGHLLEVLRPDMAKGAQGAYYTPWPACYMIAKMTAPKPGARTADPACGSGRMLLAAIQVCRENHPGEGLPICYGTDIDAMAIRACKLNLVLACYYGQQAAAGHDIGALAQADEPEGKLILLRAQQPELPAAAETDVKQLSRPRRDRPTPQSSSLFDAEDDVAA